MVRKTLGLTLALIALIAFAAPAQAATTYAVDGVHSSVVFGIKHFDVANFYGTFDDVSGEVTWDAENPGASAIDLTIAADSVDSRNSQRDDHVKSPDFLNAKQFPTITFKSKSIVAAGDDEFEVTGDLTLHGVTQEITVPATLTGTGEHPRSGKKLIGFESRFTIDRTDFDIEFMDGPLSSDMDFIIAIEAGAE